MPLKHIALPTGVGKKIYLLKPRGFCAGVVRAIDVVKIALDLYGPPVYVRKEIVHNKHVVDELRQAGVSFQQAAIWGLVAESRKPMADSRCLLPNILARSSFRPSASKGKKSSAARRR